MVEGENPVYFSSPYPCIELCLQQGLHVLPGPFLWREAVHLSSGSPSFPFALPAPRHEQLSAVNIQATSPSPLFFFVLIKSF